MKRLCLVFCLMSSPLALAQVTFSGAFLKTGVHDVSGLRLLEGLKQAKAASSGYFLGGSLERAQNKSAQQKLKASVLYDLSVASRSRYADNNSGVLVQLQSFAQQIAKMPVTGRERAEFNPLILSNQFRQNPLLKENDEVFLPLRPQRIFVLGAGKGARAYHQDKAQVVEIMQGVTHSNPRLDWVWLIQANGDVSKVGVAKWNQQLEFVAAPGAIILVPFSNKTLKTVEPGFNKRVANWLATQRLSTLEQLLP